MNPVYDRSGKACAVIKFLVSDTITEIETNLGVLKRETLTGEIRLWVPKGIKRLIVRHENMKPLLYDIPIKVESKVDYVAEIDIPQRPLVPYIGSAVLWHSSRKNKHAYLTAGYNIMSIAGPSVALGIDIKHHQIEIGGVYGLNKTDDLFFYNVDGKTLAAYRYQPVRAQVRYGYEIGLLDDMLSLTPQVGCAGNFFLGQKVIIIDGNDSGYKDANSISTIGAIRIALSLGKSFKLYVTPEYNFSIKQNNICKLITWHDTTMKNWCSGFNLNTGLIIRF